VAESLPRLTSALADRYSLERELGEGGMATVYLAQDLKHNRQVAIKVLKPELAAVVGAERFLAEIETTANLQHPHILPLFDSGEADGFLFYVMPYIEGETLADRIAREKQLPVDEAVRIATSVANALQAAHEEGIVHRDIKPGNILLSRGEPLVADFGIALAVGAGGARLTETGLSVGTPYYMSPEQATGDQAIGPSADIYALACVLFEMLVGEPPYPGNTAQAVLGKIIQGLPVSATAARKTVPANVDAAIRKALEKLPADRFETSHAFAVALGDAGFRHGEGIETSAGEAHTRWKIRALGASAVAVVAIGVSAWSLTRPPPRTLDVALAIQSPRGQDFAGAGTFDISPDGTFMVYEGPMAEGGRQLWLRRFDELTGRPIVGTEEGRQPDISPDGGQILFTVPQVGGQMGVAVVPTEGGVKRALDAAMSCCATWGTGGTVYAASGNRILRGSSDGGSAEPLPGQIPGEVFRVSPSVLPDGSGLVFVSKVSAESQIHGMKFETGEIRLITLGDSPLVTETGHLLYLSEDRQLVAAKFDSDALQTSGPSIPLIDSLVFTVSGSDGHYAIARETGAILYRTGVSGGVPAPVWVDRNGLSTPVDDDWRGHYESPALSPDGTRLAVDSAGSLICVKRLPAGPCQRLTFDGSTNHRPVWSPDGSTIVYASNSAGTERYDLDLYRISSDGSDDPELVWDVDAGTAQAIWTPDGEALIYRTAVAGASAQARIGAGDGDIFWFRLGEDSEATTFRATESTERTPDLSPDGRWLAYATDRSGRNEVVVRSFPAGDALLQVSTAGGVGPMWSHDGDELFFVSRTGMFTVASVTGSPDGLDVGEPEELFPFTGRFVFNQNHRNYDISADGERFVMVEYPRSMDAQPVELVLIQRWLDRVVARLGEGR
jgi:serine/threonine-protein kinase